MHKLETYNDWLVMDVMVKELKLKKFEIKHVMFLNARFLILLLQVANSAHVLESYKCWSSAGMGVHCDNYQEKKSLKLEHGRVEKGSLNRFVKDSDKDCFSEWFSLKKLVI